LKNSLTKSLTLLLVGKSSGLTNIFT